MSETKNRPIHYIEKMAIEEMYTLTKNIVDNTNNVGDIYDTQASIMRVMVACNNLIKHYDGKELICTGDMTKILSNVCVTIQK